VQFFADEDDVPLLLNRLNEDPELAFIVRNDQTSAIASRFKAVKQVPRLADGDHRLWHFAGHPLSPERDGIGPGDDPWAGWVQVVEPLPRVGRLGAVPSSVMHLQLWSRHRPYSEEDLQSLPAAVSWWTEGQELLASSHVSWVGNRYASIGAPAHPATLKWWARFQRWMRTNATPLKVDKRVTFWAFPSALRRLRSGIAYYANNWDLDHCLGRVRP
jgi:hypothetical protein